MKAHQVEFTVRTLCRVRGISPGVYCAWLQRAPAARHRKDEGLSAQIRQIDARSDGTHGAPRIQAVVTARGVRAGVTRRPRAGTTRRQKGEPAPADQGARLQRHAAQPVAGRRHRTCGHGHAPIYLAVVLNAWRRRVVGWVMATHLRTEPVLAALEMALARRRPQGVIHHSDRRSQYTSLTFGARSRRAGVRPARRSRGRLRQRVLQKLLR